MSSSSQVTTPGGQGGGQSNDTIYLCNFRVSVDGEWLCLKVIGPLYAELCLISITGIKTSKVLPSSTRSNSIYY